MSIVKKHFILCQILLIIIGLNIISIKVSSYSFPLEDEINDVAHLIDNKFQDQGDYQDEIDIVKLELNGTNLELTLQNAPIVDFNHRYSYTIHWDGNETNYTNYSIATIGSSYEFYMNNSAMTYLKDSSGKLVVQCLVNDVLRVEERKIIMPIINFSLIENPNNPAWLRVSTTFTFVDVFNNNYWVDYLPDYNWWLIEPTNKTSTTDSVSNSGFIIGIISLGMCIVIIYRKKKSFFN
ncbi:MAG: hypothetical protein FK731_11925 [Asgard group archaeon]|nr:hypothetical protein [Asgard group archaeon]